MDMALREPLVYCTYPQYPAETCILQGCVQRSIHGTCRITRTPACWAPHAAPTERATAMPLPVSQTRILKKLEAGQDGTKKLVRQFGQQLVCVRYRQDRTAGRRYTTVEIVVDAGPMPEDQRSKRALMVRLRPMETELRQAVVAAGGLWDPRRRAWQLKKSAIQQLKLQDRVLQN